MTALYNPLSLAQPCSLDVVLGPSAMRLDLQTGKHRVAVNGYGFSQSLTVQIEAGRTMKYLTWFSVRGSLDSSGATSISNWCREFWLS